MEIKPPSNDLYTAISRSVSTTAQNNSANTPPPSWKVSQLIQAIITKITDKQLFLNIQGVEANTAKPTNLNLQVGETLQLQIEQLKPTPQFRIIRPQSTPNIQPASHEVKNIIPQSTAIVPLLKNLSFVANRPSLRPSPLSADTNAAVRDIFKQLPAVFNLKTASQVKNHMQNSGLFIESKIKNQILSSIQQMQLNKISSDTVKVNIKPLLEVDLGAQLHRLADIIRNQLVTPKNTTNQTMPTRNNQTIPANHNRPIQPRTAPVEQASLQNITQREEAMQTFLRQIDSSLTHMQQTQLQNLSESQAGRPLWVMELPIKNGQDIDLFELRINQEETKQTEDEVQKIWNITLKFDLAGLGKVKAHIKMQNDFISAQFYSEKAEVLSLFQENFDFLRGRLNCSGLNVGNIECAQAKLSEDISPVNSTSQDKSS